MKAAVLGIGTELTDGQIVNKNACWISKKLKNLGLTTKVHLVVPDEHALMTEGLKFCAAKTDLIFITGGLGPTSDDFTRDIVSEWAQAPLQFDEASWAQVNERLTSRGYTVKEIQRQQCYFPVGSKILQNNQGTANAFFMETQGKKVFVLPGPPREIEAVWNSWIDSWLVENTKELDPCLTRKWDTIGIGESDIALTVEKVIQDCPHKNFEIGYRVHLPYVEVKLSYLKSKENENFELVEKLTEALKPCTITRDGEDILELFIQKLETFDSVTINDPVSGAFLINRMMPSLRPLLIAKKWNYSNDPAVAMNDIFIQKKEAAKNDIYLQLTKKDELTCEVQIKSKNLQLQSLITTPYTKATMAERSQQYFAEMALCFWLKCLS